MEAACAGSESFFFGIVGARNVAHELAHCVAVEIGWAEGMLGDKPPGWEDHEIQHCLSGII
jgi:hypothetical protein